MQNSLINFFIKEPQHFSTKNSKFFYLKWHQCQHFSRSFVTPYVEWGEYFFQRLDLHTSDGTCGVTNIHTYIILNSCTSLTKTYTKFIPSGIQTLFLPVKASSNWIYFTQSYFLVASCWLFISDVLRCL